VRRGHSDPLRYARAQLEALGVPEPGDEDDLDQVAAGAPLGGRAAEG
jgi:hypothetical protein